jgi:hypothetical protein
VLRALEFRLIHLRNESSPSPRPERRMTRLAIGGRPFEKSLPSRRPSDATAGEACGERRPLRQSPSGELLTDYETVRQRKDGTLVDVSIAAAPVRARATGIGRKSSALSKAGWSRIWTPKTGRRCSSTFCWTDGVEIRTLTIGEVLISYLQGEAGSGSSGVFRHPTAKGSRSRGAGFGALRFFLEGAPAARDHAKPRPGCVSPRQGFAADAALGQGESAAAGRGSKAKRPVLAQLVKSRVTRFRRVLLGRALS